MSSTRHEAFVAQVQRNTAGKQTLEEEKRTLQARLQVGQAQLLQDKDREVERLKGENAALKAEGQKVRAETSQPRVSPHTAQMGGLQAAGRAAGGRLNAEEAALTSEGLELPSGWFSALTAKIEGEYTAQLEAQRQHFEVRLERVGAANKDFGELLGSDKKALRDAKNALTGSNAEVGELAAENVHPKPETLILEPETRNPKPET